MSGLNLTLQAGTVPALTPLPGNAQAILALVQAYMSISGQSNFEGINFGPATPSASQQGMPWFKTDSFGNPLGLFSWNGTEWATIPNVTANGPSTGRPANPAVGTLFYDTTIGGIINYTSQGWSTASGMVGDVKEVQAATISAALTNNPGWVQDTQSIGLVVGGAGGATGLTAAHAYGSTVGEENHQLLITELPAHTHTIPQGGGGPASANGNVANPSGILGSAQSGTDGSTGSNTPHNTLQPTIYYWRLVKQF
jgi:microcystin-dependent protein